MGLEGPAAAHSRLTLDQTALSNKATPTSPELHGYRSTIASFAALIGVVLVFLWINRGTQFHQLAIGMLLASVTLSLALMLFELCWRVGSEVLQIGGQELSMFQR